MHFLIENTRLVVIKLGTRVLTCDAGTVQKDRIYSLCHHLNTFQRRGISVIIVSSGAIGLGMGRLGLHKRPTDLDLSQACAAIGQSILIDIWQEGFDPHGITVAQILLTRADVRGRKRHVALKNTFEKLLALNVIPIANENDSVSTDEILRFGDNDILSALVASLTKADMLIMLSTVPGLMGRGGSEIIPLVERITPEIEAMAEGTTSQRSVGGMKSKIEAARIATRSGCGVYVGNGLDAEILPKLLQGKAYGTYFAPTHIPLQSRKRWIAFFTDPEGSIQVDEGAKHAIVHDGSSLLAKGISHFRGEFGKGAIVDIECAAGKVFARGLSQYSSDEFPRIAGKSSDALRQIFPERRRVEVVHRDSLVMLT